MKGHIWYVHLITEQTLYMLPILYDSHKSRALNQIIDKNTPDSKVHGANMGSIWVLSAPDGPRVGPMNLALRDIYCRATSTTTL